MADLTFATKGQAEVLAAQEALRKKALELRTEFEEGAKATKSWDAEISKLARTSDSALRSIQTEQEKIADQITVIQERQAKGIGTTQENEAAVQKLRQKWVNVDEATLAAQDKTRDYANSQADLKSAAESALGSVKTELEEIEDKIHDIEEAQKTGLIPPEKAEEGIKRLRDAYDEANERAKDTGAATGRLQGVFAKAFDPALIIKFGASFLGIKAFIHGIRDEMEDLQTAADKRMAVFLKPKELIEKRDADIKSTKEELTRDQEQLDKQREDLARTQVDVKKADTKYSAEVEERIGDTEQNLVRAREDRETATGRIEESKAKAGEQYEKQRDQVEKQLRRAQEDLAAAKTDAARKGPRRRIQDAEEQLAGLDKESGVDSSAVKNADRRIADLERDLARQKRDLAEGRGGNVFANAERAVKEQEQQVARKQADLNKLEAEKAAAEQSPEGKRYVRVSGRQKAREEAFASIAGRGNEGELSKEENELVADIARQIGAGNLSRKSQGFLDRLTGGTVSTQEEIAGYRRLLEDIKAVQKDRGRMIFGGFSSGGGGGSYINTTQPGRPLTGAEQGNVADLQKLLERQEAIQKEQLEALKLISQGISTGGGGP